MRRSYTGTPADDAVHDLQDASTALGDISTWTAELNNLKSSLQRFSNNVAIQPIDDVAAEIQDIESLFLLLKADLATLISSIQTLDSSWQNSGHCLLKNLQRLNAIDREVLG